MKVTVDSKKGLKTNLKVFVDKKTIEEKIGVRLTELSKTVNLKGFRPGKVPVDVLKRQFGKAVYGEVLEKILKETSTKALEEKKIKVAGQPRLDLKSYGEGKDLNYTLEIDELPSIKLQSIENINFIDYEINVSDDDVKKRIDEIAKNQNNFVDKRDKEIAENGDLVAFDYEATIDNKSFDGGTGKNTQLVLGKNLFIYGFDKQLLGVKKNQEKEVSVFLPENYPKKEFAKKNAVFKCKILNVKRSELVKINDQFAKNLGAKDLNDLRQLVRKQIQNQYKMSLDALSKENILNKLEKIHDVELPDNLVKQELEIISKNLSKEDMKKNAKKREMHQINKINDGMVDADLDDMIIVSDVDEIPNLENINFKKISNKLIFFKQKMFYYKLNLFYKSFPWYGSKACKKKYFKNPEWLRSVKNKNYPLWRLDILFSKKKYNDILLVKDGGWHFTNIRKPEDLEKKLLNFLHHVDFEESGLKLEDLKRLINEKRVMYDHSIDKKKHRWGEGQKLETIKLEEMPKYIIKNFEKYRTWLDI